MKTGVNTRVKYLDLNAAFDRNNFEGEQAYQKALAGCTGLLARDFSVRFAQRFAEEPMLGFQGHDYLHLTRVIFREYYAEAGMDVPDYFPEEVQDLGAVNCRKL